MCGIIGVHLSDPNKQAYPYILNGLTILQHRGQDSAGIHTCRQTDLAPTTYKYKNVGKVERVFHQDMSDILLGNCGIGHIRYCTAGALNVKSAQPLVTMDTNISLVHNGNLTNTAELIELLRHSPTKQMRSALVVSTPLRSENHLTPLCPTQILRSGIDQNNIVVSESESFEDKSSLVTALCPRTPTLIRSGVLAESDSEILLQLFSFRLKCLLYQNKDKDQPPVQIENDIVFYAINYIMNLCRGSFSAIIMIPGFGLVAFRDPRGIRPLCFGEILEQNKYIFASESVAIQSLGFDFVRDVAPGECIISRPDGIYSKIIDTDGLTPSPTPCLFEYIYFARPESTIDGILVYQARKNMGEAIAHKIQRQYPEWISAIDVVMPVPDSARISALRASYILQKPYCEGLIKNAYVGRTFIMPSQSERKKNLKMKLNTIDQEFRDKTVLIIDDSIVRGNTSMQIIEIIRKAGAKRIIFASIAPPVRHPNVYGIAIPTSHELIAYDKTEREICQMLGADELIYNDLDAVVEACRQLCPAILGFELSCFLE
jgi:amidophosphoribosyltransferase